MPFLSKMLSFWNNLFRQQRVERDLNDELQAYVEEMAERKIQAGIAPEAAREAALLELGGIERIKDLVRQQRVGFGNLRRAGLTVVVAIVAFVSGASAAVGVMRWNIPAPLDDSYLAVVIDMPDVPRLEGRLVDKATGDPIPNVEVGLQESSPIRRYTYTDNAGHFGFINPPEAYQLAAGKERWFVGGLRNPERPRSTRSPSGAFYLSMPSNVSVKSKLTGETVQGELRIRTLGGLVFTGKNSGRTPSGLELRKFQYSSSVLEFPASNLQPGKIGR